MVTIEKLTEVIKKIEELASKDFENDDQSCYDVVPYSIGINNGKIVFAKELLAILTKD